MSKGFKSAVILLGVAAVTCAAGSPPSQVVYRETTGSRTERFTWKLENRDVIHLEVIRDNERYSNRFDSSGATTRWTYSAPQKHITAHRSNNRIVLQGRIVHLAHTHSLVDETQEQDYWAEPHASANRDLTRVLFTTNWNRSGTDQVEMFMIALPQGWRMP